MISRNPDMMEGISRLFFFFPEWELALTAPPLWRPLLTPWMFYHWSSIISVFQIQSGRNPLAVPFHPVWPLSRCHNGKKTKTNFVPPLKLSPFFSSDHFSTVLSPLRCYPSHSPPSLIKSIIVIHRFSFRLIALPFKRQVWNSSNFSPQVKPHLCTALWLWRSCSVSVLAPSTVTLPLHWAPSPSVLLSLFSQKPPSPPAPPTPSGSSSRMSVSHGSGTSTFESSLFPSCHLRQGHEPKRNCLETRSARYSSGFLTHFTVKLYYNAFSTLSFDAKSLCLRRLFIFVLKT